MKEIQHALQEEREAATEGSRKSMLNNGPQRFLTRTILGIGGQFMQQLSGINLITYVSIFTEPCRFCPTNDVFSVCTRHPRAICRTLPQFGIAYCWI